MMDSLDTNDVNANNGHRVAADEPLSPQSQVFALIGILEHKILAYLETIDVLSATAVNRRWKQAGQNDDIWKRIIHRYWKNKKGVSSETNMIFWRSLFGRQAVQTMKQEHILCMFCHPLVQTKYNTLKDEISKSTLGEASPEFLQRFVQVHMLDVISQEGTAAVAGTRENNNNNNDDDDGNNNQSGAPRIFFSDLYFGSYASSVMDSKRSIITQQELCTPFGFEMYFKIEEEDADDDVIAETSDRLQRYDDDRSILLYKYSTCYFRHDRDFRLVLRPNAVPAYRPVDLRWRWLRMGSQIQVGPYPPLFVSRTEDWGWKLENMHVVMYSIDGTCCPSLDQHHHPAFQDDDNNEVDDVRRPHDDHDVAWNSDASSDSSGILHDDDDDSQDV
ncbi:hypothetical protein IV203_006538 [Nitzschia inconspicua]|uniref:F-box domain-containing protein n=1 Tax=Nitzschia inconspicua TaxID=303405 RepID=A0A9K3KBB3_9STRA|nr:hypothetical protein IV203_006538 [Nitzschia inconspicua]